MPKSKVTDEQLVEAVKSHYSYMAAFQSLGALGGGQYRNYRNRVLRLGVDVSHFKSGSRQRADKGWRPPNTQKVDYWLRKGTRYHTEWKRRVIKAGLKANKCDGCGNEGEWNGKPLVLQVHHVDGDNTNNELTNWQFLCPNCHSQTETFTSKNKRKD